ncbi:MAG TPA: tetratricopeptide repeat protein, partial [Thermoanaerobaculaceae bacterium]|nr:tetratricopeptide repeat protein [Thermoanaerobaculaceae bacterium]
NDPANRAFCDGLTEILASTLTQFERFRETLWVVPASEVRAEKVDSAGAARRAFGVNLAVTGGVQRDGDRLRLALNLVDTANLRQLRSQVIEGDEADVSGLEDRVVAAIAEMLNLQLGTADQTQLKAGGTSVPAAYELYVQARGTLGTYQGERDPQKAADLFERAIALDPSFALAHAGLAEARLELYGWKKEPALVEAAAASARRAAELSARLPEAHITLGKIYAATGRYEDAARELQLALRLDPRSGAALLELAQTLDALGRTDAAEATYRQAIDLRPDYWLAHTRLGTFYARHGRYDQAESQFQRVIALAPENFWGYNGLGVVYFTLARNAEARAMFERALAIRPSYVLYSNLGTLAFTERNWAEAVAKFEHARAIDDRDYLLWGNLGIAYHWLGGHEREARDDVARAVELARRQLEVNPHDTAVLADLAGYHALLHDRPEALRLIRQVEADGRKKPELAIQIADAYADLDDPGSAIAWIGTALGLGLPAADVASRPGFDRLRGDPRLAKLLQAHREGPAQQGRS